MPDTTLPVFLAPEVPAEGRALLDGEEARHAATVRRLRVGEQLVLSDGAGAMARCAVDAVEAGRAATVTLTVLERWQEEPPALRVHVAQALAKGDRGELAVELATEAGADAIVPWRAARSVARWDDGPRGEKALARWRATARSAAKQARRAHVPAVAEPAGTRELAQLAATMSATLVLESGVTSKLTELDLPDGGDLLLVVGPEGGITDDELAVLEEAGATTVRLGPTVLRTSTAAAVALGALGVLTGRWH
ncbi:MULTISPECIES: 16S rRNA (uracil(1498)-N(3))-methyltransferase [Amycolatopsis]|uniref:Ribosomal RNA small subunit methyltransferase E n=1 Tax=Amycolatopsis dendrobii TaxID=2760662 RepID=A0A7W3W1Y9_9PSEU|nr:MULTISPECIES: 16S rRNA (uracil(1498)-N(3))-methyltransferase [Amycolatopsis]MBB1157366.1 16S rRNA (uracil(1498)-N(3))-methyltransferase [Amycolatopsis dendrobii]UKD59235.1 16S rRNA (uracil(1498)-N(3))-methyltransferase [Amycolatopsis sp. FU40]